MPLTEIGGVIKLPGTVAPDIVNFITIDVLLSDENAIIPEGQSSVLYNLALPNNLRAIWSVSYLCQFGCDDIALRGYCAAQDPVINSLDSKLLAAALTMTISIFYCLMSMPSLMTMY